MTTTTATTTRNASTDNGGMDDQVDPDARPKRRTFTAEYKAEILAEHDAYPKGASERGELLRRDRRQAGRLAEVGV